MARKSVVAVLGILLCCGILVIPATTGFSKSSKSSSARGKHSKVQTLRTPQKLVLRSDSALVVDQRTGERLFEKKAEDVSPIASITKLMTAMIVLDAQLNLQEALTIEREDVDMLRHSRSRLPVGSRLTRGDAMLLALMASENRAAHALGRTYPGGLDAFVTAMNAKAQSLGLGKTRFVDLSGISSGNVSTAQDLARMVDAAYHYRLVREFSTRKETTIHTGRRRLTFCNSNRLIRSSRWKIGLSKTGFIDEAGRCLVMQAHAAKRPVLIVLLDSQGKLTRYGDANRIKQWMEGSSKARRKQKG